MLIMRERRRKFFLSLFVNKIDKKYSFSIKQNRKKIVK